MATRGSLSVHGEPGRKEVLLSATVPFFKDGEATGRSWARIDEDNGVVYTYMRLDRDAYQQLLLGLQEAVKLADMPDIRMEIKNL